MCHNGPYALAYLTFYWMMQTRQTQLYLKSNQIKHSSLFSKSFFRPKASYHHAHEILSLTPTSRFSCDTARNYSLVFESKIKSVELSTTCASSSNTTSPGKYIKPERTRKTAREFGANLTKKQISLEKNNLSKSQRNNNEEILNPVELVLAKLRKQMIFEKQLLTKPPPTEYLPKIKILKRKFKMPRCKEASEYCPWGSRKEDHEGNEDEFIFNQ